MSPSRREPLVDRGWPLVIALVLAVAGGVLVGWMFVLFVSLVIATHYALSRTAWGRSLFAVGGNREAARRSGINVRAVFTSAFVMFSTFAAIGGLLAAGRLASAAQAVVVVTSTWTRSRAGRGVRTAGRDPAAQLEPAAARSDSSSTIRLRHRPRSSVNWGLACAWMDRYKSDCSCPATLLVALSDDTGPSDRPGAPEKEVVGVATRLDPFRDLERLFNQTVPDSPAASVMPMDLYRTGDHYVMRIDLPGADPGSIDVSLDDRMLTIRGRRTLSSDHSNNRDGSHDVRWLVQERASGSFARQVALGPGVSVDGITATYRDGVLVVTVPVAQQAQPRRIEVAHHRETGHSVPATGAVGADDARESIDAG